MLFMESMHRRATVVKGLTIGRGSLGRCPGGLNDPAWPGSRGVADRRGPGGASGSIARGARSEISTRGGDPATYAACVARVVNAPLRELVEAHREEIKAIVARHHGRYVAIFGSIARGDEGPQSDIDFLVELEPGTRPFELLALGAALEETLGVKVDVGTPDSLRERIRDKVLAEAVRL